MLTVASLAESPDLSDRSAFLLSKDGACYTGTIPLKSGAGTDLYAVMYLPPEEQEKYVPVLMLHGLNATADGMSIMARELVTHGYACLTFDFVNGSNLSKSGNKMKKMSVNTEKEDLLSVLDQMQSISYLDMDNLFIYSESQGGMVTAAAIPEIAGRVKGLILSYPALHIPEAIRELYPVYEEIPSSVKFGATTLGKIYATDIYDLDAWKLCSEFSGPVLIMHGTEDTSVDISFSQKAVTVFPNAKLEIIDGAGHGFSQAEYRGKTMQMASDFIQENLSE